jgi:hypothetical protein
MEHSIANGRKRSRNIQERPKNQNNKNSPDRADRSYDEQLDRLRANLTLQLQFYVISDLSHRPQFSDSPRVYFNIKHKRRV